MTGEAPLTPEEEEEALAAELALGLLAGEERAAAEARAARDPGFAARVEGWRARLAPLDDEVAEVPPPASLRARVLATALPAPPAPRRLPWRAALIPGALAGGLAAALAFALYLAAPAPRGVEVARLATQDARLVYEVRHEGGALTVARTAGEGAAPGQVHELWIIAPGAAPVSLGLLDRGGLSVPYPVPPAGWTLAVSVEPAGGSPTGAPTGPVILTATTPG
jgi:anti-sigma-K factor RskA